MPVLTRTKGHIHLPWLTIATSCGCRCHLCSLGPVLAAMLCVWATLTASDSSTRPCPRLLPYQTPRQRRDYNRANRG
jgi:hypothetical protein